MALGRFLDKLKGVVAPIAKVAAPIVGSAVAGPLGGILAGGLTKGLTTKGSFGDKLKGGLKGAAIGAATTGAMSALKGAVTGTQAAGAAANPALAQAGNAANTAAKAAAAAPALESTQPAAGLLARQLPGASAAEQLAKQQITAPPVTALPSAVTGSVTPRGIPASGSVLGGTATNTTAEVADNAAGQRFLNITNDMRSQRAAEAARARGDRLEAMRQFNRQEMAPAMLDMVQTQDRFATQAAGQARQGALENMAQGGQPIGQFAPKMTPDHFDYLTVQHGRPPAVTPTTLNPEVSTFETPGIDLTMPEPPAIPEPLPMMIEQNNPQSTLMRMLSGIGGFAKENPEIAMGIAQGLQGAFTTSPAEMARREFEYDVRRRQAMAKMLQPMFEQTYDRYSG